MNGFLDILSFPLSPFLFLLFHFQFTFISSCPPILFFLSSSRLFLLLFPFTLLDNLKYTQSTFIYPSFFAAASHRQMKISTLCIISLGLSLAIFGDAARAKQHEHHNKHVEQHHHHTPKDHSHHDKHANQHHDHRNEQEDHSHHKQADHSHHKKQQADHSHHMNQQHHKHVDHSHHMHADTIPSKPFNGGHHHGNMALLVGKWKDFVDFILSIVKLETVYCDSC